MNVMCSSSGSPVPKIKWFKNNVVLSNSNTLTFESINPTQSGVYECVAENVAGVRRRFYQLNLMCKLLYIILCSTFPEFRIRFIIRRRVES